MPTTLMFGIVLHHAVDHRFERRRIELAFFDVDAFDVVPEHLLKILFVADQAIDVRHERLGRLDRFFARPELRAEIQVVADDRAGLVGRFHRFGHDLPRAFGKRGEDPARVQPANALLL